MEDGAFGISEAGVNCGTSNLDIHWIRKPEGIQWEQAVPVAHDLACKV